MVKRIFAAYDKLRKRGLTGDLGIGLLVGVIACIVLHVTEAVSGQMWGVPWTILYGSVLGVAVTFVSAAVGVIPDVPKES